jgi:hypothetical protein
MLRQSAGEPTERYVGRGWELGQVPKERQTLRGGVPAPGAAGF